MDITRSFFIQFLRSLFLASFLDKSTVVKFKALSLLVYILVFGPIFAPRPHMGKIVRMDPKPPYKFRGVSWPTLQLISHHQRFQNYRSEV